MRFLFFLSICVALFFLLCFFFFNLLCVIFLGCTSLFTDLFSKLFCSRCSRRLLHYCWLLHSCNTHSRCCCCQYWHCFQRPQWCNNMQHDFKYVVSAQNKSERDTTNTMRSISYNNKKIRIKMKSGMEKLPHKGPNECCSIIIVLTIVCIFCCTFFFVFAHLRLCNLFSCEQLFAYHFSPTTNNYLLLTNRK